MKNNNNEAIYSLRYQENDRAYHLDLIKGNSTLYTGIANIEPHHLKDYGVI